MKNQTHIPPLSRKHTRDAKALEKRRFKAVSLFNKGLSQAEVARCLGVTRPAVHYWYTTYKRKKKEGLRSKGLPGVKSKLTAPKVKKVKSVILRGAVAAGYDTDVWTLQRIARTIRKEVHLSYHPGHVWRVIHSLGFTCQKPETRYRDRDEKAIKHWKQDTWPRIQKKG